MLEFISGLNIYPKLQCISFQSNISSKVPFFLFRHWRHCQLQCGYCGCRTNAADQMRYHSQTKHGNVPIQAFPVEARPSNSNEGYGQTPQADTNSAPFVMNVLSVDGHQGNPPAVQPQIGAPFAGNVRIKEEPVSDPEPNPPSVPHPQVGIQPLAGNREHFQGVRIKSEPLDDYPSMNSQPPAIPQRKRKTPPSSRTFWCMLCTYSSKWVIQDAKQHVLGTHLKVHQYICRYCHFSHQKRASLLKHYGIKHPNMKPGNLDMEKDRERVLSALSVVDEGQNVFVGLNEMAPVVKEMRDRYGPMSQQKASESQQGKGSTTGRRIPNYSVGSPLNVPSLVNPSSQFHQGNLMGVNTPSPMGLPTAPFDATREQPTVPNYGARVASALPSRSVPQIPRAAAMPAKPEIRTLSSTRKLAFQSQPASPRKRFTLHKCLTCGKHWTQKIKAQFHFIMKHLNLSPYICNYCSFGAISRRGISTHIQEEHPGKEVIIFPAFREHALVQQNISAVPTDAQEYGARTSNRTDKGCTARCPECSLTMTSWDVLDKHMAEAHSGYTGHKCCHCGIYMKHLRKMWAHIENKHQGTERMYQPIKQGRPNGFPLKVNDATRTETQTSGFDRQESSVPKPPVAMPYPSKLPKQQMAQDGTIQMMDGTVRGKVTMVKPRSDQVGGQVWLYCNHCSYASLKTTQMRHHVMSHIKYKPFKCSYCPMAAIRSHQVKAHMASAHPTRNKIVKYVSDKRIEASLTSHFTARVGQRRNPQPGNTSQGKVNVRKATDDGDMPTKRVKSSSQQGVPHGKESEPVQKENFVCVLCAYQCNDQPTLLRHIMWELDYCPWVCPHCEYKDVTLTGVKRHSFEAHPGMPFKMLLKQIPQRMLYIQSLVEKSKVPAPEKPVPSATIVKQEQAEKSMQSEESMQIDPVSPSVSSSSGEQSSVSQSQSRPKVETAPNIPDQPRASPIEKRIPKPKEVYQCKKCSFHCAKKKYFKKHVMRHGPKLFQCGYCSFQVIFRSDLLRHLSLKHKKKPYRAVSLADNQILTKNIRHARGQLQDALRKVSGQESLSVEGGLEEPTRVTLFFGPSIDPKAEGGLLAQLEAEIDDLTSDGAGPDIPPEKELPETANLDGKMKGESAPPDEGTDYLFIYLYCFHIFN